MLLSTAFGELPNPSIPPRIWHFEPFLQLLAFSVCMEFQTFVNAFINIPAQVLKTGRRVVYRLLSWSPNQHTFFRLLDGIAMTT